MRGWLPRCWQRESECAVQSERPRVSLSARLFFPRCRIVGSGGCGGSHSSAPSRSLGRACDRSPPVSASASRPAAECPRRAPATTTPCLQPRRTVLWWSTLPRVMRVACVPACGRVCAVHGTCCMSGRLASRSASSRFDSMPSSVEACGTQLLSSAQPLPATCNLVPTTRSSNAAVAPAAAAAAAGGECNRQRRR